MYQKYTSNKLMSLLTNKQTNEVLLEKLFVFQLAKKFPQFYRTRNFISMFTTHHHLSLS